MQVKARVIPDQRDSEGLDVVKQRVPETEVVGRSLLLVQDGDIVRDIVACTRCLLAILAPLLKPRMSLGRSEESKSKTEEGKAEDGAGVHGGKSGQCPGEGKEQDRRREGGGVSCTSVPYQQLSPHHGGAEG